MYDYVDLHIGVLENEAGDICYPAVEARKSRRCDVGVDANAILVEQHATERSRRSERKYAHIYSVCTASKLFKYI